MDCEKLDNLFVKYERIGDFIHRDAFNYLYGDIIELHEKEINNKRELLEKAFNDGAEAERNRSGDFDIENYK